MGQCNTAGDICSQRTWSAANARSELTASLQCKFASFLAALPRFDSLRARLQQSHETCCHVLKSPSSKASPYPGFCKRQIDDCTPPFFSCSRRSLVTASAASQGHASRSVHNLSLRSEVANSVMNSHDSRNIIEPFSPL